MMNKGFGAIFKQAQEMQSKIAEIQKDLARQTVEVSVGGGMVKMTANGLGEILSVKIDDELINMQDREILEDLVAGAVNEVHRKSKELNRQEMSKLTGGIKIPGLST
ncbi:MAG: YbaB/EbfC family nucleoid-associated protein [Nitrospinales bacterium]